MPARQAALVKGLRNVGRASYALPSDDLLAAPQPALYHQPKYALSTDLILADASQCAHYPSMLAHIQRGVSLKHAPFRQLVNWTVPDGIIHAMCNLLPFLVDTRSIVATESMVWVPSHVLDSTEFVNCIVRDMVFVHMQKSSVSRGPPPSNLLFVLASEPIEPGPLEPTSSHKPNKKQLYLPKYRSHAYWVPSKQEMHLVQKMRSSLNIRSVGFTRVLFDVLGKMIPEYGSEFCDKFVRQENHAMRIDEPRLARSIRLESIADDPLAIPQEQAVRAVAGALESFSTVLLNGYCGSGKTVMMIELICRTGYKTAILVNKQDLAGQWLERFSTFAPGLRVKIVCGSAGDMVDCDVVIFLIQSLFSRAELCPLEMPDQTGEYARQAERMSKASGSTRRLRPKETYPWSWLASFGLVCVDEAHRIVAATALPCLAMFPNAKIVCATATPDRNDATHDSLGPVFGVAAAILQQPFVSLGVYAFSYEQESCFVPVWRHAKKRYQGQEAVDICKTSVPFEDVNYSRMVRLLGEDDERNQKLVACILDAAVAKRRQVLVLGLIKSHLVRLAAAVYHCAKYMGRVEVDRLFCGLLFPETDKTIVDNVKYANVVFATFKFASEAFDVGTLSALVLVSPYKSRLVYVFGRILRRKRAEAKQEHSAEEERVKVDSTGFQTGGKWGSLPIVYLCSDQANPWFGNIFRKYMGLLKKTYDAHVAHVENDARVPWPDDMEKATSVFLSQGQITDVEKLFAEDLFGEEDEPASKRGAFDESSSDESSRHKASRRNRSQGDDLLWASSDSEASGQDWFE